MEEYLSLKQIGEFLGKSRQHIHSLVKRGILPKYTFPYCRAFFCKKADVIKYKEELDARKKWVSAKVVCKNLGISQSTLSYYIKKYNIPYEKVPLAAQRIWFKPENVVRLRKVAQRR